MRNWVGLHIIPERIDRAALLAMFQRLHAAGCPVPIVTVLNDAGLADDIKIASPDTVVVLRIETNNDPQPGDSGRAWLDARLAAAQLSKHADYYQFANEALSTVPAVLSTFYVSMMERALELGIKIVVGNIASGNPPGDIQAGIEAMRPMLQMASDNRFPVCYHCYSPDTDAGFNDIAEQATYYVLRYKFWRAAFPNLVILGLEAGTGKPDFQGEKTLAFMKRLNELVDILVAYWSVGWWNRDNGASQIDSILPEYEAYVMSMGGTIPSPLPIPGPDGTAQLAALAKQHKDTEMIVVSFGHDVQEFETTNLYLRRGTDSYVPPDPGAPPTIDVFTSDALIERQQPTRASKQLAVLAKHAKVTAIWDDAHKVNGYRALVGGGWVLDAYLVL